MRPQIDIGVIVKVMKTDDECKKLLSPLAHRVLRYDDTERAFTVGSMRIATQTRYSYEGRRTYQLAMHRSAAQPQPSRLATLRAVSVASPRLGPASWHRISARVPWTSHRSHKRGTHTTRFVAQHKSSSHLFRSMFHFVTRVKLRPPGVLFPCL